MSKRIPVHFDDEIFIVNGTYYYRGFPEGFTSRKEISLKVKEGALQRDVIAAKKRELEKIKNLNIKNVRATVLALAPKYLISREEEAKDPDILAQSTLYESKYIINDYFIPYFGNTKISDLTQKKFEEYCLSPKVKKLNKTNHRKVINHFMKWCLHEGIIGVRVSFEIPKKARKARRERIVPEEAEFLKMISTATNNLLLYIAMYALMGMRNMEILRLKRSECDMERREIWIDGKNNRTRKSRSIPMNEFVFQLLKIRFQNSEHEYVFPNQRTKAGKTPYAQSMHKVFKEHLRKCGVNEDITPHDLRAFFETYMHSNPDFTDTQREKMAGAKADVQKKHYVKMQAKRLKGLEESVQIEGLSSVFKDKIANDSQIPGGDRGGNLKNRKTSVAANYRKQTGKQK